MCTTEPQNNIMPTHLGTICMYELQNHSTHKMPKLQKKQQMLLPTNHLRKIIKTPLHVHMLDLSRCTHMWWIHNYMHVRWDTCNSCTLHTCTKSTFPNTPLCTVVPNSSNSNAHTCREPKSGFFLSSSLIMASRSL